MTKRYVLSGTGTHGDLLPLVSVAAELMQRGHECHVLANASAAEVARQSGVPFVAIADHHVNNLGTLQENFDGYVWPSYVKTFDFLDDLLRQSTDVELVNLAATSALTMAAEVYRLPLHRIVLAPYRVRSLEAPHWPWSERAKGAIGLAFRRFVLPGLYDKRYTHPYIIENINQQRAEANLPPIQSLLQLEGLLRSTVGLFPDWYCPKASDWPEPFHLAGFPLPAPATHLPDDLVCWLRGRPAPVVFTPGTGVVDVDAFFDVACEAARSVGRPALLLSPNLSQDRFVGEESVFHLPYVDLGAVLPHASLLVHHGGIGTTARAFQAGIPQVISPQAYDQPDNGHRVTCLGVGSMIARTDLLPATLTSSLSMLLSSESVAARCREISQLIATTDAVSSAADALLRESTSARTIRSA
ncbi:MAG: hypothetical protein RL033_5792 [Pseudomonadota bacterium]|jgi:rhamnosyltransferase subunit B